MSRDALPAGVIELIRIQPTRLDYAYSCGSKTRSPQNGYFRGWGLQYGELSRAIKESSLYREALAASGVEKYFSILPEVRLQNLYWIVFNELRELAANNIVEFGCYRGGTTIFLATVLKSVLPDAKVFALDSFCGIPSASRSIDLHRPSDFSDVDFEGLKDRSHALGLDNIVFVRGRIEDSYPALVAGARRFGLAHIDCDTYDSVRFACDAVWPDMCDGGYVILDDADGSSCLGATQAMEEMVMEKRLHSEQAWPHFVFRKESRLDPHDVVPLADVLKRRRQSRQFKPSEVAPEILDELLEVMHGAPSVGNSKPWRVVRVASESGLLRLKECFGKADQDTREQLSDEKLETYDRLQLDGVLRAPIQLAIFTDLKPKAGHGQGSTTFPEALRQSTVGAVHTLWLAAIARGLGFSWSSTFYAADMEKRFAQRDDWAFTAHVSIGWPSQESDRPCNENCGFQGDTPLQRYEC